MKKTLIEKELLISALGTLFYSWGGDTPVEVYWGANELLDWFEKEFEVQLGIRFERDANWTNDNFEEVMNILRNL